MIDPLVLRSFGGSLTKQALSAKLVLRALKARAAVKGVRVAPKMMQAAEQAAAKGLKQAPASVRRTALGAADSAKGVAKGRQAQRFAERNSRTTGSVKVGPKGKVDTSALKGKGQQSVKRRVQAAWKRAIDNPDAVRQGKSTGTLRQTRVVPGAGRDGGDKIVQIKGPLVRPGSDMGATGASGAAWGRVETRPYTQAHIQSVTGKSVAGPTNAQLAPARAAGMGAQTGKTMIGTPNVGAIAQPIRRVGTANAAVSGVAGTAVAGRTTAGTAVAKKVPSTPLVRIPAGAPRQTPSPAMGTAATQLAARPLMPRTGRTLSGPAAAYQKTMLPNLPKAMPNVRMGGRVLGAR